MAQSISVEQIQSTSAFTSIPDATTQSVLTHKSNRNKITQGVTISKTIGFLAWVNLYHPQNNIKNIVKELCSNQSCHATAN